MNYSNKEKKDVKDYIKFFRRDYPEIKLDDSYFDNKGYTYYRFHKHVLEKMQKKIRSTGDNFITELEIRHGNLVVQGEPYLSPIVSSTIPIFLSFLAVITTLGVEQGVELKSMLYSIIKCFSIVSLFILIFSIHFELDYKKCKSIKGYSNLMLEVTKALKKN